MALLAAGVGCHPLAAPSGGAAGAGDDPEFAALYAADQADRPAGLDTSAAGLAAARAHIVRDSARRGRLAQLMTRGAARTSADYYRAAMLMQHGEDSISYRLAYEWANRAVALDSANAKARWLTAAAWDRYQLSLGKPQWYGTQFYKEAGPPWRRQPVDTTRVTDAERRRTGVGTLAESRARADGLNRSAGP